MLDLSALSYLSAMGVLSSHAQGQRAEAAKFPQLVPTSGDAAAQPLRVHFVAGGNKGLCVLYGDIRTFPG